MLDMARVNALVTDAAAAALREAATVARVASEPAVDEYGKDMLNVTITIGGDDDGVRISGERVVDMLLRLSDALLAEGDERFPFLRFVTEGELERDLADPES